MVFTIPLNPGADLANVVYRWLVAGVLGDPSTAGLTQPSSDFPLYRILCDPPPNAEEIFAYDSTDLTNWNAGGYRPGLAAIADAEQILLVNLWEGGSAPAEIIPADPAVNSVCRCYGDFKSLRAVSANGIPIEFTVVLPGEDGAIFDLSSQLIKNTETNRILSDRVVKANIVNGQLQDEDGNPYVDLIRNDFILPTGTKYLLACSSLGATAGLGLVSEGGAGAAFQPILIALNTATIGTTTSGTFDVSQIDLPSVDFPDLPDLAPGDTVLIGAKTRFKVLDSGAAIEVLGTDDAWHEQTRWTES